MARLEIAVNNVGGGEGAIITVDARAPQTGGRGERVRCSRHWMALVYWSPNRRLRAIPVLDVLCGSLRHYRRWPGFSLFVISVKTKAHDDILLDCGISDR